MKRDLTSLHDLSSAEITVLLDQALAMKRSSTVRTHELDGKSIGLIFQKPSNRTRVSFEVGVWQLGGLSLYLGPEEINLGKRESTADVAKTLSRYLQGIVARTHSHEDIIELKQHATVPVINGLSDVYHPCQALADLLTVKEHFSDSSQVTLCYIGDGNNVCHSLMLGCAKTGITIRIASPKGYAPRSEIIADAQKYCTGTSTVTVTTDPNEAVEGVQVIYTDVWTSMGQENETKKRLKLFKNYQINDQLVSRADKNFLFMHCLPAHRGQEVTSSVIDSKHSIVFDQAENRMHAQKALLAFLLNASHS